MSVVTDQDQRLAAIDTSHSFICEAPAGSGKTELLTQRFLNLLGCVNKPEEILAITFTNKAAAEMRQRVIGALTHALESPEPTADHEKLTWSIAQKALKKNSELGWNLIESPARLQIKTFDSLCASLASALPIHSSYSTPPKISSDPDNLYRHAAEKLIASIDDDGSWANDLRVALSLLDNNVSRLTELMVEMLGHRSIWLPIIGGSAASDRMFEILEGNLTSIRSDMFTVVNRSFTQDLRSQLFPLLCFAGDNLPERTEKNKDSHLFLCKGLSLAHTRLPDLNEDTIHIWLGLAELLLTKSNQWRSRLTKNEGFPTGKTKEEKILFKEKKEQLQSLIYTLEDSNVFLNQLTSLRKVPARTYSDEQKKLLSAVVNLLPILTAFLNITFKERGEVDFNEVSLKAEAALHHSQENTTTEYSELTLALDYRIQHILVDEFQDSSPSQISLLETLIDGWEEGDGRTFFCVGDAMQSIYGFRAANVGLFLRSLKYGIGGITLSPLRLSTNFRSYRDVVEWNNQMFETIFPKQSNIASGAVSYSNSDAFNEGDEPSNISISLVENEESEAQCVVDLVTDAYQSTAEKSIAILVRDRKTASQLKPVLENAGLRFQAIELEGLAHSPLILDLLSLTICLTNPSDDIAAISVLRAPWSGIDLNTLYALNQVAPKSEYTIFQKANLLLNQNTNQETLGNRESVNLDLFSASEPMLEGSILSGIDNDQFTILKRVTDVIAIAHSNTGRKSLRDWVEGTWLELGGASFLNAEEMENAQVFFEMLEEYDNVSENTFPDRARLERSLKKLFSQPGPDTNKNLQIMTIHKSKGLEFDTVIIPGLHKTPPPSQDKLLAWHEGLNTEGEPRLLLSAITAAGNEKDSIYSHIKNQEKISADHESIRLLYVACTRAKSHLHLVSQVKLKKKAHAKEEGQPTSGNEDLEFCFENINPPSNSLMAKIWPAALGQMTLYRGQTRSTKNDDTKALDNYENSFSRLPASYTPPNFERGELLEPYIPFYQHDNQSADNIWTDPVSRPDEVKRVVGVVVHKLLQHATVATLKHWHTTPVQNLRRMWGHLLAKEGLSAGERANAQESLELCLKAMAEDKRAHWLLSDDHEVSKREYAIHMRTSAVTSSESASTKGDTPKEAYKRRVIDRVIKDEDELWIIDYKTSTPEPGEDLPSFASKEAATYVSIMRDYQSGLSKMGFGDAKLALYFPFLGLWHELS